MVNAPESIWAVPYVGIFGKGDAKGKYWVDRLQAGTEYVRADLYEQVKRERDEANADRDRWYGSSFEEATKRARAAERLAGARVKVKLLEWSEIRPPNEEVRYDHVVSASALGQWSIEWKSWKDYDDRTIFLDGDFVANGGENLEAAKAAAQADYERRILSALAEPAGEAEPVAWCRKWNFRGCPCEDEFTDSAALAEQWRTHPQTDEVIALYTTPPDAIAIREALDEALDLLGGCLSDKARISEINHKQRVSDFIARSRAALAGRAER